MGAVLLVDLVLGELPPARHDLGGGGLAHRFFDVGGVPGEKLVDGFTVFDHAPMTARTTDNPYREGALRMESP
ncbi:hypothetical protein GCM10027075_18070 [Streptomyces heilongjiangensis]